MDHLHSTNIYQILNTGSIYCTTWKGGSVATAEKNRLEIRFQKIPSLLSPKNICCCFFKPFFKATRTEYDVNMKDDFKGIRNNR